MGGAAVAQSNTEADILKVDTRFNSACVLVVTNFCSAIKLLSQFTAAHMIFPLSYFRPVPLNRQTRQSSHYFTSLDTDALLLCCSIVLIALLLYSFIGVIVFWRMFS